MDKRESQGPSAMAFTMAASTWGMTSTTSQALIVRARLPESDALAVVASLRASSQLARAAGDPRTLAQLRADTLVAAGRMREVFRSDAFATMPLGEPTVFNRVHICEVLE